VDLTLLAKLYSGMILAVVDWFPIRILIKCGYPGSRVIGYD